MKAVVSVAGRERELNLHAAMWHGIYSSVKLLVKHVHIRAGTYMWISGATLSFLFSYKFLSDVGIGVTAITFFSFVLGPFWQCSGLTPGTVLRDHFWCCLEIKFIFTIEFDAC